MDKSQPFGYQAIQRHWHVICNSNIDPLDLGQRLLQEGLIQYVVLEQVSAERLKSVSLHVILDSLVHNGDLRTFHTFLNLLETDKSTEWLSKKLKGV